nr:hypothetical protein [uncultured bacterium]
MKWLLSSGGDGVRGQMTVGQYRAIDLSLFALMLIVFESMIAAAATRWYPNEPYTVSLAASITAIVLMRWGLWAALHAALGGLVYCLASRGSGQQLLVYCAGNLLGVGAIAWFRVFGREGIRRDSFKALVFAATVLLFMQAGRGMGSMLLGAGPAAAFRFVTTDSVSYIITLLIIWIVRRLDGVFEDQIQYLQRVNKEREEEKGGV